MLIKSEVLDRFEFFDEIYSPGYNEENDFVCRINRCGYSAISANWAFVFHHESASFGLRRAELEERNRRTLLERYPEYPLSIDDYVRCYADPLEYFADLYRPHRPRILFDLFHLEPKHCGTSEFALNLLRAINRLIADEWELYVGIGDALPFFASELRGYRIYEDPPQGGMTFDLVYMPCQLPASRELHRMNRLAARVSFTLLDIIAVRCEFLRTPNRHTLTRRAAELADKVFAISESSCADFAAFFGTEVPMKAIHLGTNMAVNREEIEAGEYVLLIGNAFPHKGVDDALKHLDCEWPIIVLGGDSKGDRAGTHTRCLQSGKLSRQSIRELFVKARVVVYPSYYEGFGLPVADALALGKPVIVLDTAVNREIEKIAQDRNLHRIQTLKQLNETVRELFQRSAQPPEVPFRDWQAVGEEYVQSFLEMLSQEIDVPKLRARWDFLRTLQSM
jgi:glycosyltransferase involved in cell wall biosynthesis